MPEAVPLGETLFEASTRATVAAPLVKSPGGGCVESVVTPATHRFVVLVFVRFVFTISRRLTPSRLDLAKSLYYRWIIQNHFTAATR